MFFWLTVFLVLVLDGMWWRWADQRLRPLLRAFFWRRLLAAFMVLQLACFASLMAIRVAGEPPPIPAAVVAGLYLWHLLVLPATMVILTLGTILGWIIVALRKAVGLRHSPLPAAADPVSAADPPGPTRRQVLVAAAIAVPPLVTGGAAGYGLAHLAEFRVRSITVDVPNLPSALEGLRIVHISDLHIGRFTPDRKLAAIIERANSLQPDLVAVTGDLIDFALRELPTGIDMLRQLKGRYGMFICEGNHDLIEDPDEFEIGMISAGMPLLMNESQVLDIGGQAVQILGLCWGKRGHYDEGIRRDMSQLLHLQQAGAFQILLAHHPHAFDVAAEAGIPLTLSGHTHGGQLMLTPSFGAGSLMFRYWSGLYRKNASSLVVSNGAGNWFPLRVNAPTEIGHITLRRAV